MWPTNLHKDIYLACQGKDGVDVKAYEAFHTTLDAAAVYDVLEMIHVNSTWHDAGRENAKVEQRAATAAAAAKGQHG